MKIDDQTWVYHYKPPQDSSWRGREDEDLLYFYQQVECVDLRESLVSPTAHIGFAFIGFACDEGVKRNQGRAGAYEGPTALRKALAPMPLTTPPHIQIIDVGDIACDHGDLEEAQESLSATVALVKSKGWFPILFGGGHELAWGHYKGLKTAGAENLSIVNFDAHFDLRKEKNSSGTSFWQIAEDLGKDFSYTCLGIQRHGNHKGLFQTANEFGVQFLYADEWNEEKAASMLPISGPIYLTICMDVFAAPFAPGVSAPQPLGVYPRDVLGTLRALAKSGKLTSIDIAELCPQYDIDGRTAKLAANLVAQLCSALH